MVQWGTILNNEVVLYKAITLYDVKALFSSFPVEPSISIVNINYTRNKHYPEGPTCPYNTLSHYCIFASKTHTSSSKVSEQVHGAAMDSPISPPLPTCL